VIIASDFLTQTLDPGLSWMTNILGPRPPVSDSVRVLMLAIPGQESGWQNISQGDGGPGRGPYQFEPETCRELQFNPVSEALYTKICIAMPIVPSTVYGSLIAHPFLAVAMARLDLWCDPHPLPAIGDEEGAWDCYVRVWRPGAVAAGGQSATDARQRWSYNYPAALAAVQGADTSSGVIS
jgi:hypothetical protein